MSGSGVWATPEPVPVNAMTMKKLPVIFFKTARSTRERTCDSQDLIPEEFGGPYVRTAPRFRTAVKCKRR